MIPAGYVNSVVAWAKDNEERTQQIVDARNAILTGTFSSSGGKPGRSMTSASGNGKSFTFAVDMTQAEKVAVAGQILQALGVDSAPEPNGVYANFRCIER